MSCDFLNMFPNLRIGAQTSPQTPAALQRLDHRVSWFMLWPAAGRFLCTCSSLLPCWLVQKAPHHHHHHPPLPLQEHAVKVDLWPWRGANLRFTLSGEIISSFAAACMALNQLRGLIHLAVTQSIFFHYFLLFLHKIKQLNKLNHHLEARCNWRASPVLHNMRSRQLICICLIKKPFVIYTLKKFQHTVVLQCARSNGITAEAEEAGSKCWSGRAL